MKRHAMKILNGLPVLLKLLCIAFGASLCLTGINLWRIWRQAGREFVSYWRAR